MSRKPHQIYWNKKKGTTAAANEVARHMSVKDGTPILNPLSPGMFKALKFMKSLKTEIQKAVRDESSI